MAVTGLFGSLFQPTKIKGDATAVDDEQMQMLDSLASGNISGSLSGGDKLIALGALLKSVSRGSKTTPQEVLENLQKSKLQEMQTKVQLQQVRAAAEKDKRVKAITGGGLGVPGTQAPAEDAGGIKDPEYYYSIADRLAQVGETSLADAYRKQGDSVAQYTGGGKLTTAYAAKIVDDAFIPVKGIDPRTKQPFEIPNWQAKGYQSALQYIQANTPGALAAQQMPGPGPVPTQGGQPTIPTQVNGKIIDVPAMGFPVPVPGAGITDISAEDKARIEVDASVFKDLKTAANQDAMSAQQRLPQVMAMSALSDALATGKTAEFRLGTQAWLNAFGLSNDPSAAAAVSNAAVFNDLRKRNIGMMLIDQKGPASDKDLAFFSSIGAQISNTPASNRLITAIEAATLRNRIEFNKFLGRYEGKPSQALEAWGKTRTGRLGLLSDPQVIRSAVATGAVTPYTARDQKTGKYYGLIRTKSGQEFILGEVPPPKKRGR